MSLVPTFVLLDDGKWRKNPVLGKNQDWFLCFDDEESPELVISVDQFRKSQGPHKFLEDLGIKAQIIGKRESHTRFFHKDGVPLGIPRLSKSYFLEILEAPPARHLRFKTEAHDARPDEQGVYYTWDTSEVK